MKLKNILIAVTDIEKSKEFYHSLFGLDVVLAREGNVILTEGLVLQDVSLWKDEISRDIVFQNHSSELYFEEKDIDSFFSEGKTTFQDTLFSGLEDFELICFMVVM